MYNNSKVKNSLTNDGENEYNMHCEDGWWAREYFHKR